MKLRFYIASALLLGTGACTRSNPILGTWEAKNQHGMVTAGDLEFHHDTMTVGGVTYSTEYKFDGRTVTAVPKGSPILYQCGVQDAQSIVCQLPFLGAVEYKRKKI